MSELSVASQARSPKGARTYYTSSPAASMPAGEQLYPRRQQLFGNLDRCERQPVALNWRWVYQQHSATFKPAGILQ